MLSNMLLGRMAFLSALLILWLKARSALPPGTAEVTL
jgi:hypothetical protein